MCRSTHSHSLIELETQNGVISGDVRSPPRRDEVCTKWAFPQGTADTDADYQSQAISSQTHISSKYVNVSKLIGAIFCHKNGRAAN
jgi:hypothetical protein